jgi:hypothetical protein
MSAAPSDKTAPPSPTPPAPTPTGAPAHSPAGRLLLIVSGALLVGWLSWLGYTALTKSRTPIVSRAQAAVATVPVRAKLTTGNKDDKPSSIATVVEPLTPNGPAEGSQIIVRNLPECVGYTGEGEYLLLLVRDGDATIDGHPAYILVWQQRSPGSDLVGPAMVYPWTDKTGADLRQQVKHLFP